ncbi:MAG: RNA methyltransferase [Hyphomonadaceae bacterium]|nr:RNA methyltransferase [Hyphomonadaceae bacterium]
MSKHPRNRQKPQRRKQNAPREDGPLWLWGIHAVEAALANPARKRLRLVASENAARRMELSKPEILDPKEIGDLLPRGAVHQGVALQTELLEPASLEDLVAAQPRCIGVLDQLEDPHNLGAIFRSAAAFGVEALILQTRHSPPPTGVAAKSAAGAVERVLEVRVVNIARALDTLADAGYAVIGLAGETEIELEAALAVPGPYVLVLGAEGSGLRPGVAKACGQIARIPMSGEMESLNVSNAAAIAFYLAQQKMNI